MRLYLLRAVSTKNRRKCRYKKKERNPTQTKSNANVSFVEFQAWYPPPKSRCMTNKTRPWASATVTYNNRRYHIHAINRTSGKGGKLPPRTLPPRMLRKSPHVGQRHIYMLLVMLIRNVGQACKVVQRNLWLCPFDMLGERCAR